MTIQQLLEEAKKYEWQQEGPFIRSKEQLEFFYPLEGSRLTYTSCPICYIAYKVTGSKYRNGHYLNAAEALGINENDANDLACAADDRQNSDYIVWLRDQLKTATKVN